MDLLVRGSLDLLFFLLRVRVLSLMLMIFARYLGDLIHRLILNRDVNLLDFD